MNHTTQMFKFRADPPTLPEYAHFMVAGIDGNGVIYASGDFHTYGELAALCVAGKEGLSAIEQDGHLYFPVDWLEAEIKAELGKDDADDAIHGATIEALDKIRWSVRDALDYHTAESQRSAPTDPSAH